MMCVKGGSLGSTQSEKTAVIRCPGLGCEDRLRDWHLYTVGKGHFQGRELAQVRCEEACELQRMAGSWCTWL